MIQKTTIEIYIPDGYEVIKYDLPKKGDLHLALYSSVERFEEVKILK